MRFKICYSPKISGDILTFEDGGYDDLETTIVFEEPSVRDAVRDLIYSARSTKALAVIIRPLSDPCAAYIPKDLKTLQDIVGGTIESVPCDELPFADIICNDEGKIRKLPLNRALRHNGEVYDIVAGTFIIAAYDEEGEMRSLTKEEVESAFSLFGRPEVFLFDKHSEKVSPIQCTPFVAKVMRENNISIIA